MRAQFPALLGVIFASAYLSACAVPNKIDTNDLKDGSTIDTVVSDRPAQEPKDGPQAEPDSSPDNVVDTSVGTDTAGSPQDAPTVEASTSDGPSDRQDTAATCTMSKCGFDCVDTTSNPRHCGKCMIACAGSCTAGKCSCETPTPANLVRNGGFDTTATDWRADSKLVLRRTLQDASLCPGSGALTLTYERPEANFTPDIWQCIELASDQRTYNAGVWTYVDPASPRGYVDFWVMWSDQPGCRERDGVPTPFERRALPESERSGEWRQLHMDNLTPPPGTRSVRIRFGIYAQETSTLPFSAIADMFYLTPAPGTWK